MSIFSDNIQYSNEEPKIFTWIYFNYHIIKWIWKSIGWALVVIFVYINYPGSKFAIQNQKGTELANTQKEFESVFSDYRALISGNLPRGRTDLVHGKIYIVKNALEMEFHDIEAKIPEFLKPKHPDEVDYLVFISEEERLVGHYSRGGSAYQWVWHIRAVNVKTKTIDLMEDILGSRPPQTISVRRGGSGNGWGEKPENECIRYLANKFGAFNVQ